MLRMRVMVMDDHACDGDSVGVYVGGAMSEMWRTVSVRDDYMTDVRGLVCDDAC